VPPITVGRCHLAPSPPHGPGAVVGPGPFDGLVHQTLTWPGHSGQRRRDADVGEFLPQQERWTLGQYDLVVVTDFPDDETATAVVLQTVAGGNVRTTTMKAFDAEQMSAIIQRTG
jgi:hypothetical protein